MSALPKYAETNMDPEEIIKYAYTFLKVDKDNIKISTLKGDAKYIGRISYFIYSEKANKDLLLALQGVKNDNFDRSNIKVEILNGTNINGLAGNLSSKMAKKEDILT